MTVVVLDRLREVTVLDTTPSTTQITIQEVGMQGPQGTPTTVNGHTGASVTLSAADVGAVATSSRGVAGGVATLDGSALVPTTQLPLVALAGNFLDLSTNQSAGGVKTFTSIPVGPASDPTTSNQLARKAYVDTKLALAGGTMTGALTLSGAPTVALHAATKAYADLMVPLAGGTMTGALTLSGAPTLAGHAATKAYADLMLPLAGGALSGAVTGTSITLSGTLTAPTVQGSTAASGTLQLHGTSNVTKGKILLGMSSAYDEVNERLGVGTQSPAVVMHVSGSSSGTLFRVTNGTSAPATPLMHLEAHATADPALGTFVTGDTILRYMIDSNGKTWWGPGGSTAQDVNLARSGAATLTLTGNQVVTGTFTVNTTSTFTGLVTMTAGVTGNLAVAGTVTPGDVAIAGRSMARGAMAAAVTTTANGTATSGTIETMDSVLGTYQFTAVSGRRYRVTVDGLVGNGSVVTDQFEVRVRDSGSASTPTAGSTLVAANGWVCNGVGSAGRSNIGLSDTFTASSTGVHTIAMFSVRTAGSGVFTPIAGSNLIGRSMIVEDIGQ